MTKGTRRACWDERYGHFVGAKKLLHDNFDINIQILIFSEILIKA